MIDYDEYINSLDWKRKRQGFIAKANYTCEQCGAEYGEVTLQVHHLHYETLGQETDEDIQVLCIKCHRAADKIRQDELRLEREWKALNTWATKKYGTHWLNEYDINIIEMWFKRWLRRKQREKQWNY